MTNTTDLTKLKEIFKGIRDNSEDIQEMKLNSIRESIQKLAYSISCLGITLIERIESTKNISLPQNSNEKPDGSSNGSLIHKLHSNGKKKKETKTIKRQPFDLDVTSDI